MKKFSHKSTYRDTNGSDFQKKVTQSAIFHVYYRFSDESNFEPEYLTAPVKLNQQCNPLHSDSKIVYMQ